ncbi:MAG TPA: DUF2019 domain-containing protein [Stellaceae bacterium]|nr:DUF2019 domain-containing protein [Stellaceae bacterium]
MTKSIFDDPSDEQLAQDFVDLSLKQYDSEFEEDGVEDYTRLYHAIQAIAAVLRSRGVSARRALIPLLRHPNARVRINAIHQLLAIVPEQAMAALEEIARGPRNRERLDAGQTLRFLADGTYKPT